MIATEGRFTQLRTHLQPTSQVQRSLCVSHTLPQIRRKHAFCTKRSRSSQDTTKTRPPADAPATSAGSSRGGSLSTLQQRHPHYAQNEITSDSICIWLGILTIFTIHRHNVQNVAFSTHIICCNGSGCCSRV